MSTRTRLQYELASKILKPIMFVGLLSDDEIAALLVRHHCTIQQGVSAWLE